MSYEFDVAKITEDCINWINKWILGEGHGNEETKVVIGISGGCDSTVTAGLLVKALGKDRVIGVMMPNGEQKDISDSKKVIDHLGIKSYIINIGTSYDQLEATITNAVGEFSDKVEMFTTNTPARLRMASLYGLGAVLGNCRIVNTCNLSEDVVGYATLYGDSAGDFSPINHLTKTEVRAIGHYLELPTELVDKTPTDGMSLNEDGSYKSDESKLGISYTDLDKFIRETTTGDTDTDRRIFEKFEANLFKLKLIQLPHFNPYLPINGKLYIY